MTRSRSVSPASRRKGHRGQANPARPLTPQPRNLGAKKTSEKDDTKDDARPTSSTHKSLHVRGQDSSDDPGQHPTYRINAKTSSDLRGLDDRQDDRLSPRPDDRLSSRPDDRLSSRPTRAGVRSQTLPGKGKSAREIVAAVEAYHADDSSDTLLCLVNEKQKHQQKEQQKSQHPSFISSDSGSIMAPASSLQVRLDRLDEKSINSVSGNRSAKPDLKRSDSSDVDDARRKLAELMVSKKLPLRTTTSREEDNEDFDTTDGRRVSNRITYNHQTSMDRARRNPIVDMDGFSLPSSQASYTTDIDDFIRASEANARVSAASTAITSTSATSKSAISKYSTTDRGDRIVGRERLVLRSDRRANLRRQLSDNRNFAEGFSQYADRHFASGVGQRSTGSRVYNKERYTDSEIEGESSHSLD